MPRPQHHGSRMRETILEAILHQKMELAQQMKADQKQKCQEQKQRQRSGRKTRAGASWRRWPWRADPSSPSRPRLPWEITRTMPDPSGCSPASKDKSKVLPPCGSRHRSSEVTATMLERLWLTVTCPPWSKPMCSSDLRPWPFIWAGRRHGPHGARLAP